MFTKTLTVLASAALLAFAAAPAQAAITMNGGGENGVKYNGPEFNGGGENGVKQNGGTTNSAVSGLEGFAIDGIELPAIR